MADQLKRIHVIDWDAQDRLYLVDALDLRDVRWLRSTERDSLDFIATYLCERNIDSLFPITREPDLSLLCIGGPEDMAELEKELHKPNPHLFRLLCGQYRRFDIEPGKPKSTLELQRYTFSKLRRDGKQNFDHAPFDVALLDRKRFGATDTYLAHHNL